ncbi:uroporphyrinogen-III synthase [Persephonella sp.]
MRNLVITKNKNELKDLETDKFNIIPFQLIKTVPLDFSVDTSQFEIIIFTSSRSVSYFFKKVEPKLIKDKIIIAVGEKTKQKVLSYNISEVLTPEIESSEGLVKLINRYKFYDKKILMPRAEKGIDTLPSTFKNIFLIPVYKTILNIPENIDYVKKLFNDKKIDYILFTSPSNVENFLKIFKERSLDYLKEIEVIPIGKTTASALLKNNIKPFFIPKKPSLKKILKELESKL